jgi:hypothetical protein
LLGQLHCPCDPFRLKINLRAPTPSDPFAGTAVAIAAALAAATAIVAVFKVLATECPLVFTQLGHARTTQLWLLHLPPYDVIPPPFLTFLPLPFALLLPPLLLWLCSKSLGLSAPLCSLSLALPAATRRMCVGCRAAAKAGLWVIATMAPLKPCRAPVDRAGGGGENKKGGERKGTAGLSQNSG